MFGLKQISILSYIERPENLVTQPGMFYDQNLEFSIRVFKLFLKKMGRYQSFFVGPPIPLFWTSGYFCPGFLSQVVSLTCVLPPLYAILQIHVWCDTGWPLHGQHGSRAFFIIHILFKPVHHCTSNFQSISMVARTIFPSDTYSVWMDDTMPYHGHRIRILLTYSPTKNKWSRWIYELRATNILWLL